MREESSSVGRNDHRTSGGKAANVSASLFFSIAPSTVFLVLLCGAVLLYGVIYPNIHVVVASLQRDTGWSFANYREVLSQNIVLESIFASVGVSVLTVLFC
ncbi:MAG TPA: hypothetical protein VIF64_09980, partial [Pyrinomonadaceae bacterium]